MRKIQGFTLIELVVVIAILAILAATALPRFIDLQVEARQAAAQGVAGALSSGSAINYAARIAGNANAVAISACTTTDLRDLLTGASFPAEYSVSGVGAATQGTTFTCTVSHSAGGSATATIVAVS